MSIKSYKQYILLFLVYTLLGIIYTYPLISNITHQIPNNLYKEANHTHIWGDHLQVLAGFREHKNNLIDLATNQPIYNKEFCFEDTCTQSRVKTIQNTIFSPYWSHTLLNIFFSDILTYNFAILLSFITTGFASFLLSKEFIQIKSNYTFLINLIASILPTIAPARIHHLFVGHRNGWLIFIPILIVFLTERILKKHPKSRLYKGITFILLIFLGYSEQFLLLYSLIYMASRIVWHELSKLNFKVLQIPSSLIEILKTNLWFIGSVLTVFIINLINKIHSISNSTIQSGRSWEEIEFYSPKFLYLIQPKILEHEHNIYLGIGIVLMTFTIPLLYKLRQNTKYFQILLFLFISLLFFLFVNFGSNTPLYRILYDYMPTFKFARTPSRAIFFVFILLVPITSILLQNIRKQTYTIYIFLLILTTATLINKEPISLSSVPKVDKTIQTLDQNDKILFIPYKHPGDFFGSIYEYQLSFTNAKSLNGYTPFPSSESIKFTENYMELINQKDKKTLKKIKEEYQITKVITLEEFLD